MRVATLSALPAALLLAVGCASELHVQDVRIAKGVPLVETVIDGRQTVCVLDTGSANFAVSSVFGGAPWMGFGDVEPLQVDFMQIAGWGFGGSAVTLSDASFRAWESALEVPDVDCVLGAAFFWGLRVTVDYAGSRIEVLGDTGRPFRPAGLSGESFVDEALYAEWSYVGNATVADDLRGIFVYDSGASLTTLSERALGDLREPPEVRGADGRVQGDLSSVTAAGSRVADVAFESWDDPQLGTLERLVELEVDGLLGATFLAAHATTWDFEGGTVTLRPYDPAIQERVLSDLREELRP